MAGTIKKGGGIMALHDNLKDARDRVGMSQELVAEHLGISRQAVTKWESGQSKPSAKNLQALAGLYQVSTEELLAATEQKSPNLILHTNLTRSAIAAQAAFLYCCTQAIYQLRHSAETSRYLYRRELIFFLVLLVLASAWMTVNHRYEPDINQRRKNVNIELSYCCFQALAGLLTIHFGMGLVGLALIVAVYTVYVLYINPKFMNRKLAK